MYGLSFMLYRQMSPQCTFTTGGLWQRQPRLLVLFRLVLQDLLHSQPSDWLSLTEKHSILRFLIQKFLNRAQVYFMLPTPESIPVMAGNYCLSAPRGRKSRMRNSWDCPFNSSFPFQASHRLWSVYSHLGCFPPNIFCAHYDVRRYSSTYTWTERDGRCHVVRFSECRFFKFLLCSRPNISLLVSWTLSAKTSWHKS